MAEEKKGFDSVLVEQRSFPPSAEFVAKAAVKSREEYDKIWKESVTDPEGFWGARAKEMLEWFEPFTKVLEWNAPFAKWFVGGKTNVSYNCLDKHIKAVKLSGRMSTSAACLVSEEGEMTPHLEALLRASGKDVPQVKRTLELNPGHPLLSKMHELFARDNKNPRLEEYAELLFGQALLAEGGQLPDPAGFNRKVAELMAGAL